jgi:glycine oxidase
MNSWDVIIAGAGIIGVSLALELRERGAKVLVLDKGDPGNEASSAAAGMLAPSDPETPAGLRPLATESARMFPGYVSKLEGLSGIATDFRRQGTIALMDGTVTPPAGYSPLSTDDVQRLEPHLRSHGGQSFFVQENTVDPRLLMRAALLAAQNTGVEVRGNAEVTTIRSRANNVEVETFTGIFTAGTAVNCRGAWAGSPVKPRKGQMLYLESERKDLLEHVVHAPDVYIVPRSSGKILVGATVEDAGFDKTVAASTIQELVRTAIEYLPVLRRARIVESWAGLRPGTPDDLPILGLGPAEVAGVFVASGHFRNGILLAPATAKIMADVITGRPPAFDIGRFAASRFSAAKA